METIAETPRLLILSWQMSDVERLMELTRLEGLSDFSIGGYANFSEERATQWIEVEVKRFNQTRLGKFAVRLKDSKELIGVSGLFHMPPPRESEIELNYRYPKLYRGQGFAVEAGLALLKYGFEVLRLREINAVIDHRNVPSQKVAAKLGMIKVAADNTRPEIQAAFWKISKP